jgi:periplasmic protein TonB
MSDLGSLSHCMVDGDAVANGRARLLRGKALAASLVFEGMAIAVVLLWPLVTLGVLPPQLVVTPVPPFHGEQNSRPAPHREEQRAAATRRSVLDHRVFQPPRVPARIARGADPEAPSIDVNGDPLAQSGSSPWIPGGNENGQTIEIPRPRTESNPRKISIGVMDGSLIHRVEPDYPRIAIITRLSGTVVLRATIGTNGEVHGIEVLSGNPILAEAARAAVRQWRYRPTLLDGQPVEVETQITVNFVLQ